MKIFSLLIPLLLMTAANGCKKPVEPVVEPDKPVVEPDKPIPPESTVLNVELRTSTASQMTCEYNAGSNEYLIKTSGTDPYVFAKALSKPLPDSLCIFSFSYTSSLEVDDFQLYYCEPLSEDRSGHFGVMAKTTNYREMSCNLIADRQKFSWGKTGDYLRVDFGHTKNNTLSIKDIRIRPMNAAERKAYEQSQEQGKTKQQKADGIEAYLKKSFSSSVSEISVSDNEITISGTTSGQGCSLMEITPYQDFTTMTTFTGKTDLPVGAFTVALPRKTEKDGFTYDRILSKWAVVQGTKIDSHARYADDLPQPEGISEMKPASKKGLGGFFGSSLQISDLDDLGITSVTVNIVLNTVINTERTGSFTQAHTYAGKTYYINSSQVGSLDRIFKACASRKIVTAAILLNRPADNTAASRILRHPECDGGYYSMPNLTSAEGVHLYAAVLDYLASRYNGGANGRINHWILHNEVDFQKEWTNMGDQPEWLFMDAYIKSMRICSLIARQYDPHANALISLTHCWNKADGQYAPKKMLEDLNLASASEGDFPWGLACHPYPQDLTKPEFWKNDTRSTWSRTSDYCTFKNLEVINDWILSPENRYKGRTKRLLYLSENGTNSPSYSENDLALQAAGACWMWKKVSRLEGIDAVQWHNWRDNKDEGGLRIGLRKFPESPDNSAAKPVWEVYKAAGTSSEDAVFAPYLKTVGIASWEEIFHGL